ncbi:MAG: hypothetical protein RLZZ164_867 [Actinomycetota bacterium]|jgi:hypothetical protein
MNLLQSLRTKWWFGAVAIFASARLTTFALFFAISQIQEANYWTGAQPGYFDFLNIWDVEWYHRVFDHGYPSVLPLGSDGAVLQNEWAFYPGFPFLLRAIHFVIPLDWKYLAPLIATAFGFVFIVYAYKLLRLRLDERTSLWTVAIISFAWASPVLQTGYAESMQLALIAAALYYFLQRRDVLVLAALAIAALTRPGVLAFALMFAILFVIHRTDARERVRLFVLTLGAGVLGIAWLLIAWSTTGRFDAYLKTENAWRAGYTGSDSIAPFMGWFESASFYLGDGLGQFFVLGVLGLMVWLLTRPSVRAIGVELWLWSIAYLVYLFAVFFPQSSTPRILLPAFPLLAGLAIATVDKPKVVRGGIIAASLIGQVVWLLACWKYTAPDYTPP